MSIHALGWSSLARFANSPTGKATILAPFIGQYLLLNDTVFDSLSFVNDTLGTVRIGPIVLNIKQSLVFTYLGLFLYGIATIVVTIRRPAQFSGYVDPESYQISKFGATTPSELESLRAKWLPSAPPIEFEETVVGDNLQERELSLENKMRSKKEVVFDRLKEIYKSADKSFINSRRAATVLYYTSLALLAIPSFLIFICVISALDGLFPSQ